MLAQFKTKAEANLSLDHAGELVYIAPTRVNLMMAEEKWPDIQFLSTREHGSYD
jgi:peptide chain release factor 3